MTPPSEPIAKARIDSHSVINRCFQITPLANQSKIWLPTSTGLEKKNGGSHVRPNTGTVASNCHSPSATTATSSCRERSPTLDTFKLLSSFAQRDSSLRLGERPDQAGRLLGVAVQRLDQLFAGQAGRERRRLEIGRDQGEGVVMQRAGRRARAGIIGQLGRADPADI